MRNCRHKPRRSCVHSSRDVHLGSDPDRNDSSPDEAHRIVTIVKPVSTCRGQQRSCADLPTGTRRPRGPAVGPTCGRR